MNNIGTNRISADFGWLARCCYGTVNDIRILIYAIPTTSSTHNAAQHCFCVDASALDRIGYTRTGSKPVEIRMTEKKKRHGAQWRTRPGCTSKSFVNMIN